MPLTPEDVSNKRFTPVRLREGYDMGEVDSFLDEVEAELIRLTQENEQLRSGASGTESSATPSPIHEAEESERAAEHADTDTEASEEHAPVGVVSTPEAAAPVPPAEQLTVTTVADASSAAVRLLELATQNADQLVSEAQVEADRIRTDAQADAERLEADVKARAGRAESDARTRSEMLDSETSERREQLFGGLEEERVRLNAEVDNLRMFEREYRSRLKAYFSEQLASLEDVGADGAGTGERSSTQLRSLLSEDPEPEPTNHSESDQVVDPDGNPGTNGDTEGDTDRGSHSAY